MYETQLVRELVNGSRLKSAFTIVNVCTNCKVCTMSFSSYIVTTVSSAEHAECTQLLKKITKQPCSIIFLKWTILLVRFKTTLSGQCELHCSVFHWRKITVRNFYDYILIKFELKFFFFFFFSVNVRKHISKKIVRVEILNFNKIVELNTD